MCRQVLVGGLLSQAHSEVCGEDGAGRETRREQGSSDSRHNDAPRNQTILRTLKLSK